MPIDVIPVPALKDNYAYLVADRASGRAIVVDPSEAAPVRAALAREQLELAGIWCTHHHWDHVGGVIELAQAGCEVVGSAHDATEKRIAGQTRAVREGDRIAWAGVDFEVLDIPGHTLGAIAIVGGGHAFTGDMLFLAGCGRVFEGTMPMMRASLAKLRALPDDTRVWVGHEYTERNLEFAHVVEPGEPAIATRLHQVRARRAEGQPTVPGTIAEEKRTNPFLRWEAPAVRAFAEGRGPAATDDEVFARVREAKDSF